MSTSPRPHRLLLGSCPDSWGVWFADDPRQTPWSRFLDELAEVGYQYLELGPYGYLPTDPARLRDEVSRRGLTVAGGTVAGHSGLHKPGDFDSILAETRRVAELTAAMGARHVIFVPVPGYRDDVTGAYVEPAELDADGWRTLINSANEIGRQIAQDYGVRLQFHPHADSHVMTQPQVERFLTDTDPRYVSLCLDTGHLAYGRADSVEIITRFPSRIGYVHIKQMDPAILARAEAEDLAFGQAVAMGASCEPPNGLPDIPPVLAALAEVGAELFTVVEQDMYPCDFGKPKPIAERTFHYLNANGLDASDVKGFGGARDRRDPVAAGRGDHRGDDHVTQTQPPRGRGAAGPDGRRVPHRERRPGGRRAERERQVRLRHPGRDRGRIGQRAPGQRRVHRGDDGGGRATGIPADWRERFIDAYDEEFRVWIGDIAAGREASGPSAWDGYAAAVVAGACITALHSNADGGGGWTVARLHDRPGFYRS